MKCQQLFSAWIDFCVVCNKSSSLQKVRQNWRSSGPRSHVVCMHVPSNNPGVLKCNTLFSGKVWTPDYVVHATTNHAAPPAAL